jgi:hypothetical protein
MRMLMTPIALVLASGLAACDKKEESPAAAEGAAADKPAEGAAKAETPAADAGPKELKLSNGLTVMAPADAKESAMGKILTVTAMNYKCTAMINERTDMAPSFENEIKNIEKGHKGGPLKELKRQEKTSDDEFAIEWTTEKGKFGYASQKKVGDKVWACGRVSNDEAGHNCVVQICDSMK